MRINTLAILMFVQFGLAACEAGLPSTSSPTASNTEVTAANIRVIVSFHNEHPENAPQFLEQMRSEMGARAVSYVRQLNHNTHVFSIQPRLGQSTSSLLQALEKSPLVSSAELDAKASPH